MSETWESFRLEWDADGTLHLRGHDGWREAICVVCREPIRWVLDMASFTTASNGQHGFAHARCVWSKDAFDRERALAPMGHQ